MSAVWVVSNIRTSKHREQSSTTPLGNGLNAVLSPDPSLLVTQREERGETTGVERPSHLLMPFHFDQFHGIALNIQQFP